MRIFLRFCCDTSVCSLHILYCFELKWGHRIQFVSWILPKVPKNLQPHDASADLLQAHPAAPLPSRIIDGLTLHGKFWAGTDVIFCLQADLSSKICHRLCIGGFDELHKKLFTCPSVAWISPPVGCSDINDQGWYSSLATGMRLISCDIVACLTVPTFAWMLLQNS